MVCNVILSHPGGTQYDVNSPERRRSSPHLLHLQIDAVEDSIDANGEQTSHVLAIGHPIFVEINASLILVSYSSNSELQALKQFHKTPRSLEADVATDCARCTCRHKPKEIKLQHQLI